MEKWEISREVQYFKNRLDILEDVIELDQKIERIALLEAKMAEPGFWDDAAKASGIIQECNNLKDTVESFREINQSYEELYLILELEDPELFQEAEKLIADTKEKLAHFETELLLSDEYDNLPAIVDIHPGAGGTESQDWALMLLRMYQRFVERRKLSFELIDYLEGSEAGIKGATFLVKGKYAFGLLKSENGVHRLVRISPFDSNARRHTSFAAVHVTPEIDERFDFVINSEELKIDTYRSSGAGGQHVNTTDSAVRITHLPTGIVVTCQNERSQIQNRERAMKILKSKLYQLNLEQQAQKLKAISGAIEENSFGSQIRSYILHPYSLVKDHRTDVESTNPTNVLDGDLDIFIDAYLQKMSKGKKS
ncbi:MAG TPA: peptide chain release factor 2 [Bacilli bacterium]|jgi:peptide chain release factor 2|nr:MAG: Peptide chain release factor 2 [Tenericutes bacterium ADurb.Bin140]HPN90685.1 peptide chain release factor 2 [Bacilli bacterium]